ncbi:hypothetical protein NPIL_285551 [Nephila pilipes]|uniref:Uncharacterized protein n=1 Tax=Nephila pilipes TaxID=299642 RepID=A0A8X6TJK1_NEPPI|nr:hypothetical protein NPIL_285551 [Nephila pilipes]
MADLLVTERSVLSSTASNEHFTFEIFSFHRAKANSTWRVPSAHDWYNGNRTESSTTLKSSLFFGCYVPGIEISEILLVKRRETNKVLNYIEIIRCLCRIFHLLDLVQLQSILKYSKIAYIVNFI